MKWEHVQCRYTQIPSIWWQTSMQNVSFSLAKLQYLKTVAWPIFSPFSVLCTCSVDLVSWRSKASRSLGSSCDAAHQCIVRQGRRLLRRTPQGSRMRCCAHSLHPLPPQRGAFSFVLTMFGQSRVFQSRCPHLHHLHCHCHCHIQLDCHGCWHVQVL